jgi:hypothetical protein
MENKKKKPSQKLGRERKEAESKERIETDSLVESMMSWSS